MIRSRKFVTVLAAAFTLSGCAVPLVYTETEDEVVITFGSGGQLASKSAVYEELRNSGKNVVLDGQLISADAFYGFGLPNACYTNRAIFSPHAASWFGVVPSPHYTGMLTDELPEPLAEWFRGRAGFYDVVGYEMVEFDELVEIWPEGACTEDIEAELREFYDRKARQEAMRPRR